MCTTNRTNGAVLIEHSMVIRARLDFTMAFDGVTDATITVVPRHEIPGHVVQVSQQCHSLLVDQIATKAVSQVDAGAPPVYPLSIAGSTAGTTIATYRGRQVVVDHNSRVTYYNTNNHHERKALFGVKKPPAYPSPQSIVLPRGWQVLCDASGRTYLLNHNARTTTWSLSGTLELAINNIDIDQRAVAQRDYPLELRVSVADVQIGSVQWPDSALGVWQAEIAGLATPLVLSLHTRSGVDVQPIGSVGVALVELDGSTQRQVVCNVPIEAAYRLVVPSEVTAAAAAATTTTTTTTTMATSTTTTTIGTDDATTPRDPLVGSVAEYIEELQISDDGHARVRLGSVSLTMKFINHLVNE
jgi:hypothetical protein